MNIKNLLVLIASLGAVGVCQADSVHEWGHWNAEDDAAAAILAGADPTEVTEPTAAGPGGSVGQPVNPVALDHPVFGPGGLPSLAQNVPNSVVGNPTIPGPMADQLGITEQQTPPPGLGGTGAGSTSGRPSESPSLPPSP